MFFRIFPFNASVPIFATAGRAGHPRNVMLLLPFLFALAAVPGSSPPEVVPAVDLNRYVGKWHEIARLPNRFQRKCAGEVTATYTLRRDGKITVVNQCRAADGSRKSATGTASVAGSGGPNTKLKVTFFWPFSGDYWIIGLDPDYRWALVGGPDRRYLWILSREPAMDSALYERILDLAKSQGYDVSRLIQTPRGAGA
jgi:apolipoprotein D and lipocalin family protein